MSWTQLTLKAMELGLPYEAIDDITVGEIYDYVLAQITISQKAEKHREELERERKEEELLGRWASSQDDFKFLRLGA